MKGLTGRLAKHIIEESQPVLEGKRCINKIQKKVSCKLCEAACPAGLLKDPDDVDFSECDDCGICVAHCPAGALSGSPLYVQRLLDLAEKTDTSVYLSCRQSTAQADCKLGCLAAYPWEVMAAIILRGNHLFFLSGNCEECSLNPQMVLFDRSLERLRGFLGEAAYTAALKKAELPLRQSRREAFGELLQRGKRTAAAILPEEFRQKQDADLWRRLLLYRLCDSAEGEEKKEGGWSAPLITEKCRACGICTKLCPNGALHIVPTEDGRFYLVHFGWKCRGCGLCAAACPWEGIDGFGIVTMEKGDSPMVTLTGAHACARCKAPCVDEEELCIACRMKERDN